MKARRGVQLMIFMFIGSLRCGSGFGVVCGGDWVSDVWCLIWVWDHWGVGNG